MKNILTISCIDITMEVLVSCIDIEKEISKDGKGAIPKLNRANVLYINVTT